MREPVEPIQYIKLMDNTMFWNVPVKAVQFGFTEIGLDGSQKGWRFRKELVGCLDTGTTQVLVPESFYEEFMTNLLNGKGGYYDEETESYYGTCDLRKYDSVYLAIENRFYEIPPSKYVDKEDVSDYNSCGINFS